MTENIFKGPWKAERRTSAPNTYVPEVVLYDSDGSRTVDVPLVCIGYSGSPETAEKYERIARLIEKAPELFDLLTAF